MEEWKKEITRCSTRLELEAKVSNLLKQRELALLERVAGLLDRSDRGYSRTVNHLLNIKQEIDARDKL